MYIPLAIVYNGTIMTDKTKSNVIQFPYGEIRNPLIDPGPAANEEMDLAGECMQEIVILLSEYGFNAKDDEVFYKDMGCVLNLIYAALVRTTHPDYPFVEVLDVIHEMIMEAKA